MSNLQSISECLQDPQSVLHACNQMHPIGMSARADRKDLVKLMIENHMANNWQSTADLINKSGKEITDSLRITTSTRLNILAKSKKIQKKGLADSAITDYE